MKKTVLIFCICILCSACFKPLHTEALPPEYESVVRFHIRANSNEHDDQNVKLLVRDEIVEFARTVTEGCTDSKEAASKLEENFGAMEAIADRILLENGFKYTSKAYLVKEHFPEKSYGGVSFPEGIYTAVRLELGSGSGDNFWCVLFPPICLADSCTEDVLKDYGIDEFEEERYVIKFKLWESIKKLFSR